MWDQVVSVVRSEFAWDADVYESLRLFLRLSTAALLGGLLGFEREISGREAGIRTHMLVSMGAAIFVMMAQLSGSNEDAMSRVMQGIIAGIGFLCAGSILKNQDQTHVKGLTTAAGIWLTAAVGMAVGLGSLAAAIMLTLLTLVILSVVGYFVRRFDQRG